MEIFFKEINDDNLDNIHFEYRFSNIENIDETNNKIDLLLNPINKYINEDNEIIFSTILKIEYIILKEFINF